MTARHELLYDTEAALRLVDHELSEHLVGETLACETLASETLEPSLALVAGSTATAAADPSALVSLPSLLERVTSELQTVLASLRDSREALETATVEKIQLTSEKLKEVTSATEDAATNILDSLDRAQALVDDLDAADEANDRERARASRDLLREEIFGVMCALQFHDITSQQLRHASSILSDTEQRLLSLAKLFDPTVAFARAFEPTPDPRTYDPNATVSNAEHRQALADEIFKA
jgi:chemotaxis regulatin CheY-phosphate phosphatase CheZ